MDAIYNNNAIPSSQELEEQIKAAGLLPIEVEEFESDSGLKVFMNWHDFITLIKNEKSSIMFYQWTTYDPFYYLIDENEIDESLYSMTKVKELKKKIKNYNTKLLDRIDFAKPCGLHLYSFLSNNTAIHLVIKDDWIYQNGEDEILSSRSAFESLLYSNEIEKKEYEKQLQVALKSKQDKANKILFDFLISDPRYNMCTTSQARHEYARSILPNERQLQNQLSSLGVKRQYDYWNIIVDIVWKLKKNGITEFNELVSNIMYRPEK